MLLVLVRVTWVACLCEWRGWRASMGGVGNVLVRAAWLEWLVCLHGWREWRANVGGILLLLFLLLLLLSLLKYYPEEQNVEFLLLKQK